MEEESKRARFRAGFPQVAQVADQFRNVFGAGVQITYAEESGNKVGRALDEGRFKVISGDTLVVKTKAKGKA